MTRGADTERGGEVTMRNGMEKLLTAKGQQKNGEIHLTIFDQGFYRSVMRNPSLDCPNRHQPLASLGHLGGAWGCCLFHSRGVHSVNLFVRMLSLKCAICLSMYSLQVLDDFIYTCLMSDRGVTFVEMCWMTTNLCIHWETLRLFCLLVQRCILDYQLLQEICGFCLPIWAFRFYCNRSAILWVLVLC